MPLKDWSTTAASNTSAPPNGAPEGMTIANVNNVIRQVMADTRTLAAEDTIASATTCDLGTKDATFLTVSGTTTITGFGTVSAGIYKFVKFSDALTLTHNATSLILRTGANRTTVAGDCGLYKSEGSGNWREYFYSKQTDYQPLDDQLTTLAGITAQQATDLASLSTFIGTLLNDADAAAARATLEAQNTLVSGTNIKTVNGSSLLGSGDVDLGAQSLASSGYKVLPGGLIIQWGIVNFGSNTTVTLPIAFPTAHFAVYGNGYTSSANPIFTGADRTLTTFKAVSNSATAYDFHWLAIGY